jgi:hypothetical protein
VIVSGTGDADVVVVDVDRSWVDEGEDGSFGFSGAEVHAALANSNATTAERNHGCARAGAATRAR